MLKTTKEFETLVYDLLVAMRDGKTVHSLESKYDMADVLEAVFYCTNEELLIGFKPIRMAAGNICADIKGKVVVPYKGLQFIEDYLGEPTSVIANNAYKKAKRANAKAWIAVIISFATLMWNIISKFL